MAATVTPLLGRFLDFETQEWSSLLLGNSVDLMKGLLAADFYMTNMLSESPAVHGENCRVDAWPGLGSVIYWKLLEESDW